MYSYEDFRAKFVEMKLIGVGQGDEVQEVLEEALDTYRFGAYRSSYLMAYQALLLQIKKQIISSDQEDFKNKDYKNRLLALKIHLKNEDIWESKLTDAINVNGKSNLFQLNDYMRATISVYRGRRNSAAHGKSEYFGASTVADIFNFIIHNVERFHVGGGSEYWINEVEGLLGLYSKVVPMDELKRVLLVLDNLSLEDQKHCIDKLDSWFSDRRVSLLPFLELLYEHNRVKYSEIIEGKVNLVIYSIFSIERFNPYSVTVDKSQIHSYLENHKLENLFEKVSKIANLNFESKVSDVVNFLLAPFNDGEHGMILPDSAEKSINNCLYDMFVVSFGDLEQRLDSFMRIFTDFSPEFQEVFIRYLFGVVEKTYTYYSRGCKDNKKKTDTFAYTKVYHVQIAIVFLLLVSSDLEEFNERYHELHKRAVLITEKSHENSSEFNDLIDLLNSKDWKNI